MDFPTDIRSLSGQVFPVSWDAALALKSLGARFFMLIRGDELNGTVLENSLRDLVNMDALPHFIAVVHVSAATAEASHIGAAIIPQVRLCSNGRETHRHYGAATREELHESFGFGDD